MNSKIVFCFLATLALASASLDPSLQKYVDSVFAKLSPNEGVTTLTAQFKGFDTTGKLSLTQGGSTLEGYQIHQNAVKVLSAYDTILKSNNNETTKNLMAMYYEVPEAYCPKHNYNYYKCDDKYQYRNYDGSCNNLYVPWWGKRETPFERIIAPEYQDKINSPRAIGSDYKPLPNPREIAMKIHSARRTFPETTQFLVFFGQNIDHDVSLTSRSAYKDGAEKKCACGTGDSDCFNIPIPYDDYYNQDQKCFPFTRSSAASKNFDCKFSYREQLNSVTHWLDLSNIYGSSVHTAKKLRSFQYGLLKTSVNPVNGHTDLPLLNEKKSCEFMTMGEQCYMGGDVRVNDNHYLTILASIFLKEHNRIATELRKINYGWNDERLFQEARRINIAEYQHVVYYEFLPVLLGGYAMNKWGLIPTPYNTYFEKYDRYTNPQVKNAFATAAGRYGHVLVNKYHLVYDNQYNMVDNYTTDFVLFSQSYYGDYSLRGSMLGNSYYSSPAINEYMNNYLFQGMSKEFKRLSLGALNIQRGRDHGLAGYNKYRAWCGLNYAYSFDELTNIPSAIRNELKYLYASVDDIDLFTGIMSEYAVDDGVVGATTACILGDGFHDWKYGDRFWYENRDPIVGFNIDQINQIKKTTIARLVCDNSGIDFIQVNPLLEASPEYNSLVDCNKLPKVDLSGFKDQYSYE
jgi:peroxidase